MDLIYMDSSFHDIGVMKAYDFDLAFGADENNFECTVSNKQHVCREGYFLYIENTEYGGIVDTIKSDTKSKEVVYSGRTWHGILGTKIIMPLKTGESSGSGVTVEQSDSSGTSYVDRYLVISGNANDCIAWILNRVGLTSLFEMEGTTDVVINKYKFNRFVDAYHGILKMLEASGAELYITFKNKKVTLNTVVQGDSSYYDVTSDKLPFEVSKDYKFCNHLILLGSGEMENRIVHHLYADEEGNISETQTQFGLNEYVQTYNYANAESEEDLIQKGTEHFQNIVKQAKASVDCNETDDIYNIGDVLTVKDEITGISISSTVNKKIISISNGRINISYKVGEING